MVLPNYFRVMGIEIVRGRPIAETDRMESEPVAVVSQSIAETYWPGADPIGKWVGVGGGLKRSRVVGVVADTRYTELRRAWHNVYFSLHDVTSFLGAAIVLTAVALVASYIPSRWASRADPMKLLRQE